LSTSIYGQTKILNIPILKGGHYDQNYEFSQKKVKDLFLNDLVFSSDSLFFRFWGPSIIIEARYDKNNYQGQVIKFCDKKKPGIFPSTKNTDTLVFEKLIFQQDLAKKVFDIFVRESIFQMRSCDSIKEWGFGLDGTYYFIEYSTPYLYSFKKYWEPKQYIRIKEAIKVMDILNELHKILFSGKKRKYFKC
jgi:hypothetical protein